MIAAELWRVSLLKYYTPQGKHSSAHTTILTPHTSARGTNSCCVCVSVSFQVCWSGPSGLSWLWWPLASRVASSSCTSSVKSTCSCGAASRPSTASSLCRTVLRRTCTTPRPGTAPSPMAGMKPWRCRSARPQLRQLRWTLTRQWRLPWRRRKTLFDLSPPAPRTVPNPTLLMLMSMSTVRFGLVQCCNVVLNSSGCCWTNELIRSFGDPEKLGSEGLHEERKRGRVWREDRKQSHRHRTLVKTVFCGLPTLFYPCMHFLNLHWYELKMWTLCRCSSKVSVCFKWITHMTRNQSPHQLTLSHIHKAGQLSCFSFYHPASLTCFHWCCRCSVRGTCCCSCWELGGPRREPTQSWLAQLKPRVNCRIRDATL